MGEKASIRVKGGNEEPKCCEPGSFRLLDFKASQYMVCAFFFFLIYTYFLILKINAVYMGL